MLITKNNVELYRMRQGLSLRDLSKKTGISISAINRIERNLSKPYPSTAYKICRALDASFEQIFIVSEVEVS